MTWFAHLDEIKADWEILVAAGKMPKGTIEVTPAAPALVDIKRMRSRDSTMVFLSLAGVDDQNEANFAMGGALCVAHVYTRDGHTAKHGQKYERNRLASMICEQIHVVLRDPTKYQIQAPTGRKWQMGRGESIKVRNLSFVGGPVKSANPSADAHDLAHWVVTWTAAMASEPMNPDTLEDLTSIYITAQGTELGGDNPDSGDDETTSVEYT